MGKTILPAELEEQLGALSRRIENLETGAKPLVSVSGEASGNTGSLNQNVQSLLTVTLNWVDTDEVTNPHGVPYIQVYVDNDNDTTYALPGGTNVDETKHKIIWHLVQEDIEGNPNRCRLRIYILNQDTNPHTYYVHVQWTYVTASSGQE